MCLRVQCLPSHSLSINRLGATANISCNLHGHRWSHSVCTHLDASCRSTKTRTSAVHQPCSFWAALQSGRHQHNQHRRHHHQLSSVVAVCVLPVGILGNFTCSSLHLFVGTCTGIHRICPSSIGTHTLCRLPLIAQCRVYAASFERI